MITVGMNYEILEGKDKPFEKKFAIVLDVMAKSTGHLNTHLYKDVFKKRSYLIVSEWNSRSAFDDFVRSEQFQKVTAWGAANILATRPKHEIYGDNVEAPLNAGCPK